ncbi:MAG TPA: NAD(P)/FAD-dependent oxidoreductase [Candidatus Aquilonibacter sp.]|nr:NAD(P)/FAD-dependent oxidoreductase [Candidatus Aquilonibacter sp.]
MSKLSANIVGSGPNGLAAAITLAECGVAVTVFERNERIGGACSTAELTLPGFKHDVGSSCFPLGVASRFLRSLPLEDYGLKWIEPPAPLAHPLDDGTAVLLEHDLEQTCAHLGRHDARAWRALLGPSVRDWDQLVEAITAPWMGLPQRLDTMVGFGVVAGLPARMLARAAFNEKRTRALFAGLAAHSVIPLTHVGSSAVAIVLASAGHRTGWPVAEGGAGSITHALAAYLRSLGGRIVVDFEVHSLQKIGKLNPADITIFDTSVDSMMEIAGDALTESFRARLRSFRRGPGIFKVDYALREPIPWKAQECLRAGTVHVGGALEEIVRSEADAFAGRQNDRPFVLVVQPSLFDPERAPAAVDGTAQHTAWAYCHVPSGSNEDRTAVIEAQIERFAPGFADCVLARKSWNATALELANPNLQCGDVSGGAMTLDQLVARPTLRGYRTSNRAIYLCSSSTVPGGGVHGMCGFNAALAALRDWA